MLEINGLTKKYGDKEVFRNLNLSFKNGKINIVRGPSGCGKTTLFNIISGLDKEYSGNIADVPERMGYLFQEDRLLPYYSVLENVLFTMPDNIEKAQKESVALDALSNMELVGDKDSLPHELSGGMARRTAIARVLAYPCELLLLDEPFNGLDLELKSKVIQAVKNKLNAHNTEVIMITHDLSVFSDTDNINFIDISCISKQK